MKNYKEQIMDMKSILFTVAVAALGLSSCNSEDNDRLVPDYNSNVVRFAPAIQGLIETRVTGNAWDGGERVGIFMCKNADGGVLNPNVLYTINASTKVLEASGTPLEYPEEGAVDFYAYTPYSESLSGTSLSYTADGTTDLLRAEVKGISKSENAVSLPFKHQLANIVLEVKKGTNVTDLTGLSVTINKMPKTADLDLKAGTWSNQAGEYNGTVTMAADGESMKGSVIVIPCTNPSGASITFSLNGASYTWTGLASESFNSYNQYTYTVTLSQSAAGSVSTSFDKPVIDNWVNTDKPGIGGSLDAGNGSQAAPYSIAQVKGGVTGTAWIGGFKVNAPSVAQTFSDAEYIYLADAAGETAAAAILTVDVTNSSEKAKLLATPIGTLVKINATIAVGGSVGDVTGSEGTTEAPEALTFGQPQLNGMMTKGTALSGVSLSVPCTAGNGTVGRIQVEVGGAAAAGISVSELTHVQVVSGSSVTIPVSGTPTTAGEVTFTVKFDEVTVGTAVTGTVQDNGGGQPAVSEVILEEDFSGVTKGKAYPADPGSISINDYNSLIFEKGFQALGAIKFGASSAAAASLTTPALGEKVVGKKLKVTFKAASWTTDKTTLLITVENGGTADVSQFTDLPSSTDGQMEEQVFYVTDATVATTIKIANNSGAKKRFWLDDLKIETVVE